MFNFCLSNYKVEFCFLFGASEVLRPFVQLGAVAKGPIKIVRKCENYFMTYTKLNLKMLKLSQFR